jgi:hypothetical protein
VELDQVRRFPAYLVIEASRIDKLAVEGCKVDIQVSNRSLFLEHLARLLSLLYEIVTVSDLDDRRVVDKAGVAEDVVAGLDLNACDETRMLGNLLTLCG